jgi:hypothetical protein
MIEGQIDRYNAHEQDHLRLLMIISLYCSKLIFYFLKVGISTFISLR